MKKNHNNPVIAASTLLLLLVSIRLTACAPATPTGDPLTPTPEVVTPPDPSPTPSNSDLPLSCQVTGLKVYEDKALGFCLAYPDNFMVNDQPSDKPLLQAPAVDAKGEVYPNLRIEVTTFDVNKSLDQQVDDFMASFTVIDPAFFEHARISVAGESAILVENARVDNNPVQMNWRIVFVPHAGSLYRLIYRPMDVAEVKADLDALYQTTIGSFTFLYQEPSSNPISYQTTTIPAALPTTVPSTPTAITRCDWVSFIADITVPDESTFGPSTSFVKTWRLKNIGACTWTTSYSLVFVSGDQMGNTTAIVLPKNVAPGETVDVSVTLTSPAASKGYKGNWMLKNASGVTFGSGPNASSAFWVKINVASNVACREAANMKVYVDNAAGYCLAYPKRFTLIGPSSDKPLLQGPAVDSSDGVSASMTVEIAPFVVNKSLAQQVDEFLRGFTLIDPALFENTVVTVGGKSAILVERYRDLELQIPVQTNWRVIFVKNGNNLYRLIYWPMDSAEAKADVEELYQVTTSTFTFIK